MRYLTLVISITLTVLSSLAAAGQSSPNNGAAQQIALTQKSDFENALKNVAQSKPETILRVAEMHRLGIGTPKNMKEAFKYYREASRLNYAPAQERIAQLYLSGDGIKEDKARGIEWLSKAARNGSYEAMIQLSVRYKLGTGVEKNEFQSQLWSSEANTLMKKRLQQQALPEPTARAARKPAARSSAPAPFINPNIKLKKPRNNDYGLDRL